MKQYHSWKVWKDTLKRTAPWLPSGGLVSTLRSNDVLGSDSPYSGLELLILAPQGWGWEGLWSGSALCFLPRKCLIPQLVFLLLAFCYAWLVACFFLTYVHYVALGAQRPGTGQAAPLQKVASHRVWVSPQYLTVLPSASCIVLRFSSYIDFNQTPSHPPAHPAHTCSPALIKHLVTESSVYCCSLNRGLQVY